MFPSIRWCTHSCQCWHFLGSHDSVSSLVENICRKDQLNSINPLAQLWKARGKADKSDWLQIAGPKKDCWCGHFYLHIPRDSFVTVTGLQAGDAEQGKLSPGIPLSHASHPLNCRFTHSLDLLVATCDHSQGLGHFLKGILKFLRWKELKSTGITF